MDLTTLDDVLARMESLRLELEELSVIDDFSEDDQLRWDTANTEFEELRTRRTILEERAARLETVRAAARRPENREPGDGAYQPKAFGVNVRADDDPYDTTTIVRWGRDGESIASEYRARARKAIELAPEHMTDAQRENATRLIDRQDPEGLIAEHILRTGSPVYHRAFMQYLKNPIMPAVTPEERTALSLSNANGGYMVPFTLDPTIILTNDGATNPFRDIATIRTIATDDWNGVTSAGVTAEWLGEATEAADASPTVGQPTITTRKGSAYIQASFEIVADSGVAADIGMLIADAKNRLEATAFAVGNGTTQPKGVVTALQAVTASRVAGSSGAAGAADYVVGDVYALANALPPRYRPNSSWVAEQTIYNRTRQFATGSGPQHAFWADLGVGIPPMLLGRPTYESSAMDNTIVSGSNDDVLVLGDFRHGYFIIDRIGLSMVYNPLVIGTNRRPTGEVGWFAYWRVGADVVDPNAFRMLRV